MDTHTGLPQKSARSDKAEDTTRDDAFRGRSGDTLCMGVQERVSDVVTCARIYGGLAPETARKDNHQGMAALETTEHTGKLWSMAHASMCTGDAHCAVTREGTCKYRERDFWDRYSKG